MADPLATTGHVLRVLRAEGVSFVDAWSVALPPERTATGERSSVWIALNATRLAWESAFYGRPATDGERAAALLFATWAETDAAEDRGSAFVGTRCG